MPSAAQRFAGKVAVVTGAGGGLGSTLVRRFAAEGAAVYAVDAAAERGEAAAAAAREAGGDAVFAQADVASPAGWQALVQRVQRERGALHVLVNNAGVVSRDSIRSVPLADWQRVLDINLTGPMLGIQCCAPLMRDCGGGAIVNIGSTAALLAHRGVAYCASKWGLRGVTASAALELLDWGIRVNSVHPAQIQGTAMTTGAAAGWSFANRQAIPMQRAARAEEVAQAVLFLASEDASYTTGGEITVDGGQIATGLPRVRAVLEAQYDQANAAPGAR